MVEAAFRSWLDKLQWGLNRSDAEAISMLFAEDAVFHDAPFIAPRKGRMAILLSFQEEMEHRRDPRFQYDVIRYEPGNGWATWSNGFTRAGTDEPVRIEGILNAEFDADGLCKEFKQWWHALEPGQSDMMRDFDA